MTGYPNVTGGYYTSSNLFTHPESGTQYAAVIGPDHEVGVHKRAYPDGVWSGRAVLSAAERTILGMPTALDDHNYAAIGVDVDGTGTNGRVHVIANLHETPQLRYLVSSTPGDITSPLVQGTLPNLPSSQALTYPNFVRLQDGTLMLFMRSRGWNSSAYWQVWTKAPGASGWTDRGPLFVGEAASPNHRGVYPTQMMADPDTGWVGVGMTFQEPVDKINYDPSFYETLDGITWWYRTPGGRTAVTLPITPTNNPGKIPAEIATLAVDNGGACCYDADGNPVYMNLRTSGGGQRNIYRWTGTAWTQQAQSGFSTGGRPNLFRFRGQVHMLSTTGANAGGVRKLIVANLDTGDTVATFGNVRSDTAGVAAGPFYEGWVDPGALLTGGTVDVLVPRDSAPYVYRVDPRRPKVRLPGSGAVMVPTSIDSTGTTDTAAALTSFFASVPDGSTVRFQPGGTYNVNDGTFDVTGKTGLTIDTNGATIRRTRLLDQAKRWPKNYPWVRLTNCTNVTVTGGGTIQGLNIGDPNVYGAHLDGFTHGGTPGYVQVTPPTPGYEELVYFPTSDLRWGQHVPGADNIDPADPWWGTGVAPFPGAGWFLLATQHDPQNPNQWSRWQEPTMTSVPGTKADHGAYCEALAFEHGIHLEGGSGVTVEDVTMVGVGGDYVFCRGATGDGHTIRNISNGRRNGRQGFALISGGPYLIEDCGLAPVPPEWPETRITSALALATPAAIVPIPASETSLTQTLASGLICLRS